MVAVLKSKSDIESTVDDFHFYGRVEKLSFRYVAGWAFVSDMPGYSCKLELWVDQQNLATIRADIPRDDVAEQAADYRACGFLFEFDEDEMGGKFSTLEDLRDAISIKFVGHNVEIDRSHVELERQSVIAAKIKNFRSPSLTGYFDGIRDFRLSGWCVDSNNPDSLQQVCIKIDDSIVGFATCDIYRQDLTQTIPSGIGGFEFNIPYEFFDDRPHYVQVVEAVSRFNLPASPQVLVLKNTLTNAAQSVSELSALANRLEADLDVLKKFVEKRNLEAGAKITNYNYLYKNFIKVNSLTRQKLREKSGEMSGPLISIVMPTYEGNPAFIHAAIESVRKQIYLNWELVISDDCTTNPECLDVLKDAAGEEPRIVLLLNDERGGISGNTNRALKAARGDIVAFMDYDDLIEPEALLLAAEAFATGNYDVLYSDEDKIDERGEFVQPHYKPAFNYDLLLGVNYICHMVFVAKAKLEEVGFLRPEFDGAQDWDLLLRLSEKTPAHRIGHIPRVIYHWRISPTSTAASTSTKSYVVNAGLTAVQSHLTRSSRQAEASMVDPAFPFPAVVWRPNSDDLVSVIIPTRDHVDLVINCISSLRMTTRNIKLEIIVADNDSSETSRRALEMLGESADVKIVQWGGVFNYSAINNFAVRHASGKYILLLNNDVYFSSHGWLGAMLGAAQRDRVGAVGLKLLYPDGTVQHDGVIIGQGGIAGHAFTGLDQADAGYFCRGRLNQEVSAVTAACLLVSKANFEAVGGFDEKDLTVAFNDVDLCMKLRRAGLKNLLINTHFAYHAESKSRGYEDSPAKQARFLKEIAQMRRKWGSELKNDLFYNPNFDLDRLPYTEVDLEYASQQTCLSGGDKLVRSSKAEG